jgi:uncharacterized protein YjbI with pentapeptide repeats
MSRRTLIAISVICVVALTTLVVIDRMTAPRLVGGCRIEPKANCYGKDLSDSDLSGEDMTQIVLSEGRVERSLLIGTDLTDASLYRTRFTRSDLSDAAMSGAVMAGAQLQGARLIGTDLTGADLKYADLTDADLTDAVLANADLFGAKLEGAVFSGTVMPDGTVRND